MTIVLFHPGCCRNQDPELAKEFTFPIPIFHSYGHSSDCQKRQGGRGMEFCGVCDGKTITDLFVKSTVLIICIQ